MRLRVCEKKKKEQSTDTYGKLKTWVMSRGLRTEIWLLFTAESVDSLEAWWMDMLPSLTSPGSAGRSRAAILILYAAIVCGGDEVAGADEEGDSKHRARRVSHVRTMSGGG
jgi:hypothetical protein